MKIPLIRIPVAIGPLLMLFVCVTGCGTKIIPQLHSFESDGCSSFPDGTASEPVLWRDDCVVHDYAYWKGGTWKERRDADRELRDGIRRKGKPVIAQLAYVGVRVGGTPWLPTPWRWGFGWHEFPRGYRPVSLDEWLMIKKITPLPILEK